MSCDVNFRLFVVVEKAVNEGVDKVTEGESDDANYSMSSMVDCVEVLEGLKN